MSGSEFHSSANRIAVHLIELLAGPDNRSEAVDMIVIVADAESQVVAEGYVDHAVDLSPTVVAHVGVDRAAPFAEDRMLRRDEDRTRRVRTSEQGRLRPVQNLNRLDIEDRLAGWQWTARRLGKVGLHTEETAERGRHTGITTFESER